MSLQTLLVNHHGLSGDQNLFYQNSISTNSDFEKNYIDIRAKEQRIYTDEQLRSLPRISSGHTHAPEWKVRQKSSEKLKAYLGKKHGGKTVLEIGCGNGWLSSGISELPGAEVLGLDVNETELKQAASVFKDQSNLNFIFADIFSVDLPVRFNYIILASSIQYFENFRMIVDRCLTLTEPKGEVHILDSPFYNVDEVAKAQQRSSEYFMNSNSAMKDFYFHHQWRELEQFKFEFLYDPKLFMNRLTNKLSPNSPFPWIRITK